MSLFLKYEVVFQIEALVLVEGNRTEVLKTSVNIVISFTGKIILQVASNHLILQKNLYLKNVRVYMFMGS